MPSPNPMTASPPGAFLPGFPGQSPGYQPNKYGPGAYPGWSVGVEEGENFPAAGASQYILLGPGASPGFHPTPYAPGLWPWWAIAEEEAEFGYFYAGTMGDDTTFFLTDLCPNCGNVHRTYTPPAQIEGEIVLIIPCYSGVITGPVFVPFTFAGMHTRAPSAVLNAIAIGKMVGT